MKKTELTKLGIFELRAMAREVGVKSPTTLKVNELINKILNIQDGKEKPYVNINLKGRPPKVIQNVKEISELREQVEKLNYRLNLSNENEKCLNINYKKIIQTYKNKLTETTDALEEANAEIDRLTKAKQPCDKNDDGCGYCGANRSKKQDATCDYCGRKL